MFTRQFFTFVSWAGGSKGQLQKKAFRSYVRTMGLFIMLVRHAHADFSETASKEFFKSKVIANSRKRAENPQQRVSRVKHRKRSIATYNQDDELIDHVDDNVFDTVNDIDNAETTIAHVEEMVEVTHTANDTVKDAETNINIDPPIAPAAVVEVNSVAAAIVETNSVTAAIEESSVAANIPKKKAIKRKRTEAINFMTLKHEFIVDENDDDASEISDSVSLYN